MAFILEKRGTRLFLIASFLFIILLKLFIFIIFMDSIHSKSVDALYYHDYAIGLIDAPPSTSWPLALKFLNEIGIYSRPGVIAAIFIIGNIIIPLQVASFSQGDELKPSKTRFWATAITISIYPTLYYFSLDITRDIPMIFIFLLSLNSIKRIFSAKSRNTSLHHYIIVSLFGCILFSLREYLGVAYITSFILCYFYSFYNKKFITIIAFGLFFASIAFSLHILTPLIDYRDGFTGYHNDSTLGIIINPDENILIFNLKLVLSTAYQLFGLYIYSFPSFFLFISESLPFAACFILLARRIKFTRSRFIDFLMIFFFCYSFTWILANDNLGTAIRLRMLSYIPVFIALLFCNRESKCIS